MAIGPMKPDGTRGAKNYDNTASRPAPPPPQPMPVPQTPFVSPYIQPSSTGQYQRPQPVPSSNQPGPVPDIEGFLGGDSGYQEQLRQLAKALTDFQADTTRRRGTVESEFGQSDRALRQQRERDLDVIEDDYASRGLLRSGLYTGAVGDYEKEFGERVADITRRQQEALALLQQETGQFTSQQELAKQAAREAAIRRRAEQYGS